MAAHYSRLPTADDMEAGQVGLSFETNFDYSSAFSFGNNSSQYKSAYTYSDYSPQHSAARKQLDYSHQDGKLDKTNRSRGACLYFAHFCDVRQTLTLSGFNNEPAYFGCCSHNGLTNQLACLSFPMSEIHYCLRRKTESEAY